MWIFYLAHLKVYTCRACISPYGTCSAMSFDQKEEFDYTVTKTFENFFHTSNAIHSNI